MAHDVDRLNRYLAQGKTTICSSPTPHLVLGNQAADLDSMASSTVYAFFLSEVYGPLASSTILPVINIPRADLPLRPEAQHLFADVRIDTTRLTFVDEVHLEALLQTRRLQLTLIDHNQLADEQYFLRTAVVEILDHHVDSEQFSDVVKEIAPVGSTATLVTERVRAKKPELLGPGLAKLLLGTILLDTVNLSSEAQRVTERDQKAVAWLDTFTSVSHAKFYTELEKERTDVTDLSTDELMRKDMKIYSMNYLRFNISSIPIKLHDWMKREEDIGQSVYDFSLAKQLDIVILMLFHARPHFGRELILFSKTEEHLAEVASAFCKERVKLIPIHARIDVPRGAIAAFRLDSPSFSRKMAEAALRKHLTA